MSGTSIEREKRKGREAGGRPQGKAIVTIEARRQHLPPRILSTFTADRSVSMISANLLIPRTLSVTTFFSSLLTRSTLFNSILSANASCSTYAQCNQDGLAYEYGRARVSGSRVTNRIIAQRLLPNLAYAQLHFRRPQVFPPANEGQCAYNQQLL